MSDRVHACLDLARVGRDCEEAMMLLFKPLSAGGIYLSKPLSAGGIYLSNPMQRVLRDTIAAAQHITQNADDMAGVLGGYLLDGTLPPFLHARPGE